MIEEVVNRIGELVDAVNTDKWVLAEAIHDAYAEFKPYEQNLTSSLSQRCKLSSTQLYNLRDAWELRSWFGEYPLSVSHYAKMHNLAEQLNLTPGDIQQYFELAVEEGWSVIKLAQEVSQNHMDNEQKENITYKRWLKTMRKIWQYAMFNSLPRDVRDAYYKLMQMLEETKNV